MTITLPNNRTRPGVIAAVGTVATAPAPGRANSMPTATVLVNPTDLAATGSWDPAPVNRPSPSPSPPPPMTSWLSPLTPASPGLAATTLSSSSARTACTIWSGSLWVSSTTPTVWSKSPASGSPLANRWGASPMTTTTAVAAGATAGRRRPILEGDPVTKVYSLDPLVTAARGHLHRDCRGASRTGRPVRVGQDHPPAPDGNIGSAYNV